MECLHYSAKINSLIKVPGFAFQSRADSSTPGNLAH